MKNYYLLGEHLGHSFSAEIHNRLFKAQKTDAQYSLLELPENRIKEKLEQLKNQGGANVTIPYKQTTALYMDELLGDAQATGCVNTIIPKNGRLIGENTDGEGFMRALSGWTGSLKGQKALILGAGGAAHVIAYRLALAGARVHIWARRGAQAMALAEQINRFAPGGAQSSAPSGKWYLAVNATPAGMGNLKDLSPIPENTAFECEYAFDCIYNPSKTLFLRQAEEKGAQIQNGLAMLWHQAIKSQELWGNHFDGDILNRVLNEVKQL
ncbi:MAG: shikimate dehydrogenase [Christensenellaceae bacterium]|nr:shikimate dehydrogenase [Christensenellaceae bacterium]